CLGTALLTGCFAATAQAATPQNLQWTGTLNWTDSGQWLNTVGGGLTGFNSATPDSAIFSTTGNLTVPLGANVTVGSISFNAGANSGFVIKDTAFGLTLNSGITLSDRASSATESIQANLALAANQTWTIGN